jgi:hypothetical protein
MPVSARCENASDRRPIMLKSILFASFALATATAARADSFTFVALGDMPYGKPEEVYAPYEALIGAVNARKPAFSIHIGDIKSGSTLCDNEMLDKQRAFLDSFETALVYTPGDNEWTDCHRKNAGGFDPLERLTYLRSTFYSDPAKSRGKVPMSVESQALVMADQFKDFPENARFSKEGVLFVTAHVVGSNNNFEVRDKKAVDEYFARNAANVAWLNAGFDKAIAENAPAIVVAFQADMFDFDFNEFDDETFLRHSGFFDFGSALVARSAEFGKPVLIVYGDSHIFRVTRPFPKTAANVMALEVYGDKDMHAVEVSVDPADPAVFSFHPIMNPSPPKAS